MVWTSHHLVIFLMGSPGNSMMAVLRGAVRISVPSTEGREIVLAILQPREVSRSRCWTARNEPLTPVRATDGRFRISFRVPGVELL
jgi:hypothetical protein